MTELLFGVLLQGLTLWNTKEANKFLNRVVELKREWLEEYSKIRSERNNSSLDEIESELYFISKAFIEMGGKK